VTLTIVVLSVLAVACAGLAGLWYLAARSWREAADAWQQTAMSYRRTAAAWRTEYERVMEDQP
jgi:hypothetical protein